MPPAEVFKAFPVYDESLFAASSLWLECKKRYSCFKVNWKRYRSRRRAKCPVFLAQSQQNHNHKDHRNSGHSGENKTGKAE